MNQKVKTGDSYYLAGGSFSAQPVLNTKLKSEFVVVLSPKKGEVAKEKEMIVGSVGGGIVYQRTKRNKFG